MRLPFLALAASLVAAVVLPGGADAETAETVDFAPLINAVVAQHVVPHHAAFAAATADLAQESRTFCAAPGSENLKNLRMAYAAAMGAWQRLRPITFGPIEDFNRRFRIQFWPDKRNTAARHLAEILDKQREDILKPGGFTFASVAVQGLPVVERLLYDEDARSLLNTDSDYPCRLLTAVSGNLAAMAADLRAAWTDGDDSWAAEVAEAATTSDLLGTSQDVATLFLNGLTTELAAIKDLKLERPLGANADRARPTLAESWRSRRSMANIVANLESIAEMYRLGFLPALRTADPDLAALLHRAFHQTIATARGIPVPLEEAVASPAHRPQLEKLLTEVTALRQLAGERAAERLGLVLGFNSLDGD